MRMYDLIQKKKEGKALTTAEINEMIKAFTNGDIPNEQMSAFAMAVYFQGMTEKETADLTMAMAHSGDLIDLSAINGFIVDKHSTGGVGDKTSFIIMSIVSALGVKVAKMSGRGLGHTGGTLDKAEAIPGFKIDVSPADFIKIVNETGACLAGQTGDLAPADKKLYALRDVTATVDNISLIAASIMSKKIASGANGIVLDVKTGSGAFMKTLAGSIELAKTMVKIGDHCGRTMAALITDMDIPTGYAIGNALEIIEATEVLKGRGPADLKEICLELAATMLHVATNASLENCREQAKQTLESGAAYKKFLEIVAAQGGDISYLEETSKFPEAKIQQDIVSSQEGYITHMNTESCGLASSMLGAGREKVEDAIDYAAGIMLKSKTGDFVRVGDVLATFHTNDEARIENAKATFLDGLTFGAAAPEKTPLIYKTITISDCE